MATGLSFESQTAVSAHGELGIMMAYSYWVTADMKASASASSSVPAAQPLHVQKATKGKAEASPPSQAPAKPAKGGSSGSSTRFRVAALHGHAQSASRFKGKIAALTKEVKSLAEFEFVDGPFPVAECEHSLENNLGAAFTWLDVSQVEELGKGTCTKYADVDKSFQQIMALECDSIIAFSMGAAVLASLLVHPEHGPILRGRLRFVGIFSGFIPKDPQLKGWIDAAGRISELPSFHCMGEADEEISIDKSEELATLFEGATIYRHEGGHVVPAAVRKDFKAFLAGLPR